MAPWKMRIYDGVPKDKRRDFFAQMGYYFASKAVRKDLGGYPLGFDDDFVWIIAESKRGDVLGFASLSFAKSGVAWLQDAWVDPDQRRNGIYRALLDKRVELTIERGASSILAMVRAPLLPFYEANGFHIVNSRGQWYRIEKDLSDGPL